MRSAIQEWGGVIDISEQEAKSIATASDPHSGSIAMDLAGQGLQKNSRTVMGEIGVGSKHWCSPEVQVEEGNLLGIAAMWPCVWFDFKKNQIGFAVGPSGCLESKPIVKQPLHACWDRSVTPARLLILGVKLGSRYETADILAGDVLQAFGELKGAALDLASLREAVLAQKARWLVVERKGQTLRVELPEVK